MATPGDFSRLNLNQNEKDILTDAYSAVTQAVLWEWLKRPDIPGEYGFMFSPYAETNKIVENMKFKDYHSGASLGWVLRKMEYIAKNGWEKYVNEVERAKGEIGWCGVVSGGVPACDY